MPLFGGKKNEKKDQSKEAPSYPKQAAVPPPQMTHYPQGGYPLQNEQFFYSPTGQLQSVPNNATVAFARTDLPGAYDNFCEGFLDGPDFSNRVPDRNIPPAPGSFYFYSQGAGTSSSFVPPYPGAGAPAPPPPMPPVSSAGGLPPPPSYDQVLSQEVKKEKL